MEQYLLMDSEGNTIMDTFKLSKLKHNMMCLPSIPSKVVSYLFSTNQISEEDYRKYMLDSTNTFIPKLINTK